MWSTSRKSILHSSSTSALSPFSPSRFLPNESPLRFTQRPIRIISRALFTHSQSHPRVQELQPFHPQYSQTRTVSNMVTSSTAADPAATTAVPATDPAVNAIESAKRKAAYRAVADFFRSDMRFVGIGSGSTIVYGVEAIKDHLAAHPSPPNHMIWFVPTGWNSRKVIEKAGLNSIPFDSLPANVQLDVAFDGADEVDAELNCIKGGGACLFQEKLVACRAKKFVCIADFRKKQARLLTKWPAIPIEVAPISHAHVLTELKKLGSVEPRLREHVVEKTGPIQTDQNFYIIDAPFKQLLTATDLAREGGGGGADGSGKDGVWDVDTLAVKIKSILGVLEVGIFHGLNGDEAQAKGLAGGQKPVAAYFGREDGEVDVRKYEPPS